MDKSPLLANGYNPPPTTHHLSPMQFMALNHAAQQAAAAAAAQHAAIHQTNLGLGLHHHQQTPAAYPHQDAAAPGLIQETPTDAKVSETGAR